MSVELTEIQQKELEANHGFVQGSEYVLMSKETYRRMMGLATDDDLAQSLAAIEAGLGDIVAGRTRQFRELLQELGTTCGTSRSA